MANTTAVTRNETIRFQRELFLEYVRNNRFADFTGTDAMKPFQIKEEKNAVAINFPLVTRLRGSGVTGSDTLDGNEESLGNYSFRVYPTHYRNGIRVTLEDDEKTEIDVMRLARPQLMEWAKATCRDRQIQALGAIFDGAGATYSNLEDASETDRDAWLTNNTDRVTFGNSLAGAYNPSGGDMSAGLAQIDGTTDGLSAAGVAYMHRLAVTADPHIRPIMTSNSGEVFVLFVGSQAWTDLRADLESNLANWDNRGMKIRDSSGNVISRDDDLYYRGVIVRHVPEITKVFSATGKTLATVGTGNIAVEPAFLCGAQAAVWGLGKRPYITTDMDKDYGFQPGVSVTLKEDIRKVFYYESGDAGYKQANVVTGFFAGS